MKSTGSSQKLFNWENKTILLIDNDTLNRKLFSSFFKKTSCQLICESDRLMVLNLVKNHKPDIILTELCFSYIHGIELIREIRKMDDSLPIIVQTFRANEEVKEACLNAGCNYYFTKPLDFMKLMSIIDFHLNSS